MNLDPEDLRKHIEDIIFEQNNRAMPEFEGYSPYEMRLLLYYTYDTDSPVRLQKLPDPYYEKIPMLNQVRYLMRLIDEAGEMKLTQKGFLPTKVVADIYRQGFIKNELIEAGIYKLYKETDCMAINLTRILLKLAGLIRKRYGKISLTKAAKKIGNDNHELLQLILTTFTTKFNWAYYDNYSEGQIGQLGFGFSLILLSKYGEERRPDTFYAEKYFKAFPDLLASVRPIYGTPEKEAYDCYSVRTFERFLDYFGLITIEEKGRLSSPKYITKTDLFDRLIHIEPHKITIKANSGLN